jgi:hypothetical protein
LRATDQQAVANASDRLDEALAVDPETKGKQLGTFFTRADTPFSVLYLSPADRMVRVVSVKRVP